MAKYKDIVKQNPNPTQQLAQLIESRKAAFALVAGKHFQPERLVKLAHGALSRNPKIAKCTPASVLVSLMRCAELELEPDSAMPQKRMWLVPRWNKKINSDECTYIVDYRAQIQLARESGLVSAVVASEVREHDKFVLTYDAYGNSITKFEFHPGGDDGPFAFRGQVIGYFAAARLEGGEVQIAHLSKADAEIFRDLRAAKSNKEVVGPWRTDFDAMAIKTCLRRLWNLLPAGKNDVARHLQKHMADESAIDEGTPVQDTAPIELDLGVREELPETTDSQVQRELTGQAKLKIEDYEDVPGWEQNSTKAIPVPREPGEEG